MQSAFLLSRQKGADGGSASLAPCSTLCPLEPKNRRFCAVQAFCAAKPWRRANSLRPSILISCRNPKKEVTTYVVTSFFGAGDEARSRHCRAATRTASDKRPTGAFSRFARALFAPLPAGAKKSALLRRTSVLRSKTLAESEFTSPEHFNFPPESKKKVTTYVVTSFLERATRLELATSTLARWRSTR